MIFNSFVLAKILCAYSGHTMLRACVCMSIKIVSLELLLILQERRHILKLSFKKKKHAAAHSQLCGFS